MTLTHRFDYEGLLYQTGKQKGETVLREAVKLRTDSLPKIISGWPSQRCAG